MRDVKFYPKDENRKKQRRRYTPAELKALFVTCHREAEWQFCRHHIRTQSDTTDSLTGPTPCYSEASGGPDGRQT